MVSSVSSSAVDGLVSGLDTANIVSQLMSVEAAPQAALKTNVNTAQTKVAALQSVNAKMAALQTAAETLGKASTWAAATATTSSDSAKATAGSSAVNGSVTLNVTQLATSKSVISTKSYSASNTGAAKDLGYPLDVVSNGKIVGTVSPSTGTLSDVVAAINKASGLGITAVAVRVGEDSYRLQITATKSGAKEGNFELVPHVNGQSAGIDGEPSEMFDIMSSAQNAEAFIVPNAASADTSYPVTSSSNTFADIMQGVSLTVSKAGAVTTTVATDSSKVSDSVKALVDAANAALSEITAKSKAGTIGSTGTNTGAGALSGDSTLRSMKSAILTAVTSALGGTTSAAKYGIQSTREGALTFDAATFLAAYQADPKAAQTLLAPTSVEAKTSEVGVAERLLKVGKAATDSVTGSLTTAIAGQNSRISDLTERIADWDVKLAQRKERYQAYYSRLEVALGKLQSQSSWLAGQLSGLNS